MAKHQAAPGAERVSVTALLFPLVSVLYFEAVFSYFARTGMTVYKVLFALSAGAFGLALSRLTPSRVLNFLLQSAWLLFCGGLAAASVETFGVVPEAALDFKYNVLHLQGEEIVRRYVVSADGTRSELPAE